MREIPLTQGRFAKISDHRYEELSKHKWWISAGKNILYAHCNTWPYYMHLFILSPKEGFVTDHIDNDGLNNMDENLRYLTQSENVRKNPGGRTNKLGYRGIDYRRDRNVYRATAILHAKQYHVGHFTTLEEAVEARRQFLSERGVADEFLD
jgi:HNH endonuclease